MTAPLTDTDIASTFQRHYRVNRANYRIQEDLGFRIQEASRKNMGILRKALLEGSRFAAAEEPPQLPYSEQEIKLFDLIIDNITIKHCLHNMDAVVKSDNQLRSIRERLRLGEKIGYERTGGAARQDYIYFSCGIGKDHHSRYMTTGHRSHEVVAKLSRIWQEAPHSLMGLYISPHDNDMDCSKEQRPVWFSGTKFYFKHDNQTKSKTYYYEREDGTRYTRTVKYEEEFFYGRDVMPAIAHQLILHLRFIGGRYREHILQAEGEEQLRYLEAFMEHVMPLWVTPEAKIPARFSIDLPGIEVITPGEIKERESVLTFKESDELYDILTNSNRNLEPIWEWIDARKGRCNVRKYDGVPIVLMVLRECYFDKRGTIVLEIIKRLQANGAPLHAYCPDRNHAFGSALRNGYFPLAKWLLSQRDRDPRDPEIEVGISVNSRMSNVQSLLSVVNVSGYGEFSRYKQQAIEWLFDEGLTLNDSNDLNLLLNVFPALNEFPKNFYKVLPGIELLMKKGLPIHFNQTGSRPLMLAAQKPKYEDEAAREKLTTFLLENGAKVNEVFDWGVASIGQGYTALHFAADSGSEGVACLLLDAGADPNAKALNGETPLSIARKEGHDALAGLLLSRGAEKTSGPDPLIPLHSHCVACVVTGVDAKGNSIVVLGQKFRELGGASPELLFPGGYKDINDDSFVDAAMREMEEEANIPLRQWVQEDGIEPSCIHRSEQIADDNESLHHLEIIHFDVGARLQNRPIFAEDDLLHVSRRRLKEFDSETFSFGNTPVRYSNGVVLRLLAGKGDPGSFTTDLEEAIRLEREGEELVEEAIRAKDLGRLREVLDHPLMRSGGRPFDIYDMFMLANKEQNDEAIHILQPLLLPHEITKTRLEKIFLVGCKVASEPLITLCREDPRFKISLDMLLGGITGACYRGHLPLIRDLVAEASDQRYIDEMSMEGEELDEKEQQILQSVPFSTVIQSSTSFDWVDGIDFAMQECTAIPSDTLQKAAKCAAREGNSAALNALLKHQRSDQELYQAMLQKGLYGAVQSGRKERVQELLDLGGNPFHYDSYKDEEPFDPIPKKISRWSLNQVKGSLLEYVASSNKDIHLSREEEEAQDFDTVMELLLSQPSPDEKSQKHLEESAALAIACHHGHGKRRDLLLEDRRVGLGATYEGKTALVHQLEKRGGYRTAKRIAKLTLIRALKKEKGYSNEDKINILISRDRTLLAYSRNGARRTRLSLRRVKKELLPENHEYTETVYNTLLGRIEFA